MPEVWEVGRVEAVTEPFDGDPDYRQRVNLVQRNAEGKIRNVATGIRNTELEPA
jgi:hypothetical protein